MRYEAYREGNFSKYTHLKLKVWKEIQKARENWIKSLKESPYGIWKMIKKPNFGFDLVSSCNSDSPIHLPDLINQAFSSAFSPAMSDTIELSTSCKENRKWPVEITVGQTKRLIGKLKSGKAGGIDNLTTRLLKAGVEELAAPLTHLFVESVSSCVVPKQWKTANVVPIPKKKRPTIEDFRPISLLPLPSKILEAYVLMSVKESLIKLYAVSYTHLTLPTILLV